MAGTNFPNGIYSKGVPILGAQGFMTRGKCYFVDPANGDDGSSGDRIDKPFKTLAKAEDMCVANQNDCVYLIGGSSSASLSASLTWDKDYTHLFGICSPVQISQRARIGHSANFSPMITVSASGCWFDNLCFMYGRGGADNHVLMELTGGRNVFSRISFHNCMHQTEADDAETVNVNFTGALENSFYNCTFGASTIERGAANATLKFNTSSGRLYFKDCLFKAMADKTTPLHISVAAGGLIDTNIFEDCLFCGYSTNWASAGKLAACILDAQTATHEIILKNCFLNKGIADWEATAASGNVYINPATATAAALGILVNNET